MTNAEPKKLDPQLIISKLLSELGEPWCRFTDKHWKQ